MSLRRTCLLGLLLALLACDRDDDERDTVSIGENSTSPWLTPDGSLPMPPVPGSGAGGGSRAEAGGGLDGGDVGALDAATPVVPGADAGNTGTACQVNADCALRDVGSCCGTFPRCVNVNATFTPPSCNGQSGPCGFPVVSGCECRANQCVELANTP